MKRTSEKELEGLFQRYPALRPLEERIRASVALLAETYRRGGKLMVCGNGGSAADSLHIVGELMKSFSRKRPISQALRSALEELYPEEADLYTSRLEGAVPAISLVSETSLLTAFGNDAAAELAFAQQVAGQGRMGDVLMAISTSGNSANVLHAARVARAMGLPVIALTGQGGGKLAVLSDILIDVPAAVTHHVQELHLPVYHGICQMLETELFGPED